MSPEETRGLYFLRRTPSATPPIVNATLNAFFDVITSPVKVDRLVDLSDPTLTANLLNPTIVTLSSGDLCQNFIALKFARKWCDAKSGYLHHQVSGLGVSDENGFGNYPKPFLLVLHNSSLSTKHLRLIKTISGKHHSLPAMLAWCSGSTAL